MIVSKATFKCDNCGYSGRLINDGGPKECTSCRTGDYDPSKPNSGFTYHGMRHLVAGTEDKASEPKKGDMRLEISVSGEVCTVVVESKEADGCCMNFKLESVGRFSDDNPVRDMIKNFIKKADLYA